MRLITTTRYFPSHAPHGRPLLLMAGYGGRVWQLRRLVVVLNEAGYDVTALDFSKSVLSRGDVALLPQLVEEVKQFADDFAKQAQQPVLLVGVSLGSLLALNVVRNSPLYRRAVMLTGGDIAKIAKRLYPKRWSQSYEELAKQWQDINMYTDPEQLRGKRLLFVVHTSKKVIDTADIYQEVKAQQQAGNSLVLIEKDKYDHIGTIIDETIFHPKRTLGYIAHVEAPVK